jgi:anaerobic carbon-monoxide dehydrogenase iron sulfur subunit
MAPSRCQTLTVAKDEYVPMMCLQCDHAACVAACPVGAIAMDSARGIVLVDGEKCIRCQACVVACPFGNMHEGPAPDPLVHKCDLCATCGEFPRCALFCPTQCLTVEG